MNNSPSPIPTNTAASQRNPGDEEAPGTFQTAENTCPECHGTGKKAGQDMCPNCGGTGVVIVTVGDA